MEHQYVCGRHRLYTYREVTVSSLGITTFGAIAVTFMMVMYALERRHPGFVLAFAFGCLLSGAYGFLSGAWPFGVVEVVWAVVAVRRYMEVSTRRPAS
jgi:hypothetical protein